jgi:hypothetical protein
MVPLRFIYPTLNSTYTVEAKIRHFRFFLQWLFMMESLPAVIQSSTAYVVSRSQKTDLIEISTGFPRYSLRSIIATYITTVGGQDLCITINVLVTVVRTSAVSSGCPSHNYFGLVRVRSSCPIHPECQHRSDFKLLSYRNRRSTLLRAPATAGPPFTFPLTTCSQDSAISTSPLPISMHIRYLCPILPKLSSTAVT